MPGTKFCASHGGGLATYHVKTAAERNYKLTKWHTRVGEFSDSASILDLSEEIGILRMTLEQTLESCKDTNALLMNRPQISMLADKIQTAVTACHKMATSMGALLPREKIIQITGEIIEVLSTELTNSPEVLRKISIRLKELLVNA